MDDIGVVNTTTTSHSGTTIGTKVTLVEEPVRVLKDECGISCVQGYYVKDSVAPILEAIFRKHGDIAAECVFKTVSVRSVFLEVVCEVVKQIQSNDDVYEKMKQIECKVSDAEAANVNVSWIRSHLDAIHKRKEAIDNSNLLMELKVNTILVKRAAHKDLNESCAELVAAQLRYEKAKRCARVLHLVEKNLTDRVLASETVRNSLEKQPIL
ncbi:uncharacterized protein [Rutidosis leptorrhynchoides]|uniref:uncharacterized protein isoform X2 n=1 Tax=Rutidosis leptorrhynchoides TaxID=125765 RepID=UPI003A9A0A66